MARKLTEFTRNNWSIDWTIKTTVRAKLKVMVKRLLRQYGYPLDKRQMATNRVIEQAKGFAENLSGAKQTDCLRKSPMRAVADKGNKYS